MSFGFDLSSFGEHVCICGPPLCGKTSMLFQHALSCAEKGSSVLFISPSPLDRLPLLGKDSHPPSPHLLKSIQFKYPTTMRDLQGIFDGIHLLVGSAGGDYECIVVDDLQKYFTTPPQARSHDFTSEVARLCAHIADAVKFLSNQKRSDSAANVEHERCTAVVALTHPFPGIKLEILQRWVPTILKVNSCGENQYTVNTWKAESSTPAILAYTVLQTYIKYHQHPSE